MNRKALIALSFATIMIFSGVGIMGFEALSQWTPSSPVNHRVITDTESASSFTITYDYKAVDPLTGQETTLSDTITVDVDYEYIDLGQPFSMSYVGSASYITGYNDYFNDASFSTSSTPSYTPSSTGTFDVGAKVTTNDGTYGTTDGMSLTVEPALTVSISSSGTPDAGQDFTLTASASGGYGSYSYQWYSGSAGSGTAISGATSSSYDTSESSGGSYDFYVEVTDDTGNTVSSLTFSQTVNSDPSISISSSRNPSDAGQTIDFSTSTSGGTGSYTSYSYVLYDGTSTSDSQLASGSSSSFSYTFSNTGSYLLDYSVTDSNGYTSSTSITQTVNSDPLVSISSSQNPTDVGKSITLTASASGGTGSYSYQWYEDSNAISGATGSTYSPGSYSSSGTYDYYVSVTDQAGYTVDSNTVSETVNSDPTVSASSNVSSADVNYPIEFSSSPSGGSGGYSYSWVLNGNQISTSQDFSYAFSSSGSYTLTVTMTDAVGVSSSATVSVTINPNPSLTIASSQNPADVGNSVTFSSTLTGGTGSDTYLWTINGAEDSTASEFSYTFGSAGTYYVNVTVTDGDGHEAKYSLKETVNPDPDVSINVQHNPTDAGIWAVFASSVTGGTGPYNYSWSINGDDFYSSSVNYTFPNAGTFPVTVTVTDANGNTASDTVDEVVNADPSVTIQASYTKVDQGINDTFSASVTGGTSPFNYTWSLGSKILNYSAEFHMNFSAIGTYTLNLTVLDSLGEKATASFTVSVIKKPSALIEGTNEADVSTSTYWEGFGSYGTAPYNYYWFINGVNTSSGLYLEYSFPKTGKYNISLLIDDSQGSKAYAYLNVTVQPLPKITISESIRSTDVGIPVIFNSSVSGGSPFYNYSWSIAGYGYVGYQQDLTYNFPSPGEYNVTVSVTDGSGNRASASMGIRVNGLPSVSIYPKYSNIDPNVTDAFNANLTGGTPAFHYSWYVSGLMAGNGSSLSYSFSSPGIYPVKIVVTDSLGESASYVTDITVASYPRAYIISSSSKTDANVSDQFRASGLGGIGPYKYEWVIAGHIFTNQSISYSFKSPGNYSVQLIISDFFGKDSSSSVNVSVFPDPTISVSWTGHPIASKSFRLKANITGGIAPYSVSWIFPSGQHETGLNIVHVFSISGPETFEIQATDQSGFTETRNFTIDVSLYVAISANQTAGLGPLPVQFSSSVLGGSDYSYNWTFSPGHVSLQQNPEYTFPVGNYTVHFLVTSANGATGQANVSIQSLPKPVTFEYSSGLNITRAFDFRAIPNWDAKGPYNMSWSFPNGQTLTGMNISYKFPVYNELNTVIATFSYDSGKQWTKYLTIRMVPAIPSLTFSPPSIIPVDTMLSLNATATSPDSSTFTYSWDINGTSYTGQNQLYYFDQPGNYSISVTVTDGLGATASLTHDIQVLPQGTNSSIAISYTKNTVGPMSYFTVKVQSISGIAAMEAFLDTTELTTTEINSTYTSVGELAYFNLTMDQRDYTAGTYGIQIVVFNNNSASNHLTIPFAVSSSYSSSSFSLGDLISFFGGMSNFLITMLTLGGLVIAWASLRRTDNPNVTIVEGSGKKAKRIQLKGRKIK